MTLIFDERRKLQKGEPGLHAFIIGISVYPHLPEGRGKPAQPRIDMKQLDSTALSAYKMYCWLLKQRKYLPVQLASIRLLVSPSLQEKNEISQKLKLKQEDACCTRDNFVKAAIDWRKDASTNENNITFFYFAGHGIEISKYTQALLLEDFANPDYRTLNNAVDFMNIYEGMRVSDTLPNMARTQLYFIDACRNQHPRLEQDQPRELSQVFSDVLSKQPDQRCAPIFYATSSGGSAYSIPGDQTVFSKAMLKFLDGYGGEKIEKDEESRSQVKKWKWHIAAAHLSEALQDYINEVIEQLKKQYEPDFDQKMKTNHLGGGKTTIIYLNKAPKTDLILQLDPSSAVDRTQVQIQNGGQTRPLAAPIDPHPYIHPVSCAGQCIITAQVNPPHSDFLNYPIEKRLRKLKRPSHHLLLKMTP